MAERVIDQVDAELAEDGKAVLLYRYWADASEDIAAVHLPIAIKERNFLRAEWEAGGESRF